MNSARVLQFCHGYEGPFLDCARQYAALFSDTSCKVTTVYLTGEPDDDVKRGSVSDEVIFLGYRSRGVRGLKLGAIRDIQRISKEKRFHFCIAHRFKPVYAALLGTDLPVIGVHHAFGDYRRLPRRLFANFFRKRLSLLGVSNAVRDDMRASLPSWPENRIETLYNRIDIETVKANLLSRAEARTALSLPENAWIAGNVGRLHPDKDQATLIRAFAKALLFLPPDSVLAIIGSGPLESTLKKLAVDLGVLNSVWFLGQVRQARRYFKAFDAFALSSDHEPFGMVLLEALAAGVPLICSDCGGGREVVEGLGKLFPFGNIRALSQCLVSLSKREIPDDYQERAEERLRKRFSDQAGRAAFRQLEFVKQFSGEARAP